MSLPSASHRGRRSAAAAATGSLPTSPKPARSPSPNSAANRQVTFSKLSSGLLRKAHALSVLCDAEVATIIFSSTGRLSEFSSPSMSKIIKRYEDIQGQTSNTILLQEREYWKCEYLRLRKQVDCLDAIQSYIMGGDVMNLSASELEKIESQLQQRMEKMQENKIKFLETQTQEMMNKENMLWRENNLLKQKLAELMSDDNPTSCEMSESSTMSSESSTSCEMSESSTMASESVNGPQMIGVLDTKLKMG